MFLGVVARVGDVRDLPAAETFLEQLAARVRNYPPELVRSVRLDDAAERAFFEKHAALYLDPQDLHEIRRRVEARRDYEIARLTGTLLDDQEAPPPATFDDLAAKYRERAGRDGPRFTNSDLKATVLLVEATNYTPGSRQSRLLLDRVKADVAALNPATWAANLRIGYTSDIAVNAEETNGLKQDLSSSSLLVMAAVLAVILLYYRWWKAALILVLPLLLATAYAFSLASLPPISITELNSNTAFLGCIIVGNGVNFGIVLLARYREARARGASVEAALVEGVWGARSGTIAAAAAAGVAYASLVFTDFRGFRQFGFIGGMGMMASWATAFLLMPPLLVWVDDGPPVAAARSRKTGFIMRRVACVVRAGALALVAGSVLLTLSSAYASSRFTRASIEQDLRRLRRADTWTNGAGYWGHIMDAVLGREVTPTVLLCDSERQARQLEELVRASAQHGALESMVANVVGIDDVLPASQSERLEEARGIRGCLTPRIRSLLSEGDRCKVDRVLSDDGVRAITLRDLPPGVLGGLQEKDGTVGRTLLVYPRSSEFVWNAAGIHRFVGTLRQLASEASVPGEAPARIAGELPLSDDILASMEHDAPIAAGASLLGVLAVVMLVVRDRRSVGWVLGSLLVGVLWMAGATMALHIKVNFTNFIALPITLGIGVDYAVNVIMRFRQDGNREIAGAVTATGGAVALCSLTTIIGYSSLLLAQNRALFWFGVLAVMGELACLAAAVLALPAWLVVTRKWTALGRDPRATESVHPAPPARNVQ